MQGVSAYGGSLKNPQDPKDLGFTFSQHVDMSTARSFASAFSSCTREGFSHSPRAICTVLLDPRDPFLQSGRTPGFTAAPVYGRAKCLLMLEIFKT